MIDYGPDWNTCWIVQIYETGQIKHFDSNDIRIAANPTYGTEEQEIPKSCEIPGN
jgi:hypothetical protein